MTRLYNNSLLFFCSILDSLFVSIFFNVKEKQQLYVTIHEFTLELKKEKSSW